MALLTLGTIGTGLAFVFPYWKVPVRYYQWWRAEETDPQEGQIWRERGISKEHQDWKIIEMDEDGLLLESTDQTDDIDNPVEEYLNWSAWERDFIGKRKAFCKNRRDTIQHQYWGDAEE